MSSLSSLRCLPVHLVLQSVWWLKHCRQDKLSKWWLTAFFWNGKEA